MTKRQLKSILKQLRHALESIYKERLVHLVLFGSQARGEDMPESDIDVLVVLQGNVDPGAEIARTGEITASLSLEYDVVLSCIFVSEERYANERNPLLINVRGEGIPV